jgi:acetylornithine/N-succinyldiaminopimelate aminotransferase
VDDPTLMTAQQDTQWVMETAKRPALVMVEGHGSWLTDSEGRRYLDFVQGWAVNCLGHSHPVIAEAVTRQAARLINPSPSFFNDQACALAELLGREGFGGRTFFANSGAEANEGAIKLARKWGAKQRGGAFELITTENSFHGRTLATMSASGKPQWRELYEPKVPGFVKVPFGDLGAIEGAITERTAAVMIEPIQGEGGVNVASKEFLQGLRALTAARGVLLILDEIQTGIGRTGSLFAYQQAEVVPDIMTLGKGLGGGLPIAALVARPEICCFEPGDQGGTFNGNPLVTAVAIAVLREVLRPGFLADVVARGQQLREILERLSAKHQHGEVRGRGLLLAMALRGASGPALVKAALERGLLINAPREDCLRFMPALNLSAEHLARFEPLLDEVLSAARA